ncbi:hypothetical protein GGTG_05061 [Gaeumannomyces tritici R3-111a-1]|uniref:Major facilitator superfamily (MFS) profile domain-containing protein n=1 Tax=Gaeumannomyces tritici (strain R3-111a-1) TaxID=644352 RepID=J3NUV5_GAET3|nr:hypothetical protein GGTG_05061 [Gaeumannomyces tritici R3-111a-1]EJT79979.1 hypothetical protein GGTG_05061 [Gaeumannomyces tritici R3-111a-1]
MEGWRELGNNFYALNRASIRMITVDPQFDLERCHDEDDGTSARAVKSDSVGVAGRRRSDLEAADKGHDPFDDAFSVEPERGGDHEYMSEKRNPFADENAEGLEGRRSVNPPPEAEEPYHIFSTRQKWLVVVIIGVTGMFSGLSSNIYFPALDSVAKATTQDLNVSLNDVSLTITSYLIIQGISPVIWGSLSDALGRRPIYIASALVYIVANIGLSFSPNFAVLLIFRGLQAAGSASTVSLGNGVIQDISPPAERGSFISFYQAIRNFSIAIGPVLGGLLANFLGFRSIFVFLLTLSSIVLLMLIVFLPETMRRIAGNGTMRLKGIYKPLIYKLKGEPNYMREPGEGLGRKKVTLSTFLEPLKLLLDKAVLCNLIFGGVVYAIWSMVTSSTTGLFKERFGLSELFLGLAFIPNGLGTIVGSAIAGKLMMRDYRAAEAAYLASNGLPSNSRLPTKELPADFPIERARTRNLPWIAGLFAAATAVYGFSLQFPRLVSLPGWIALPLILQFVIAGASNAVFALNQTLVTDLCPGRGASSTAVNNLVRCGLGAVGVAFVDPMIAAVGPGAAFLGLALVVVTCIPLVAVNWFWGMEWRVKKVEREKGRL